MKRLSKLQNSFFMTGAVLLLFGAAVYPTGWLYAFYIYAVGAVLFVSMQLLAGYEGRNLVLRRLRRQQIFGALMLLCTAACMAMRTFDFGFARGHEWLVCLAIACVLELYTAFRIPAEWEKESEGKSDN